MMRRLSIIFMTMLVITSLVGCGNKKQGDGTSEVIKDEPKMEYTDEEIQEILDEDVPIELNYTFDDFEEDELEMVPYKDQSEDDFVVNKDGTLFCWPKNIRAIPIDEERDRTFDEYVLKAGFTEDGLYKILTTDWDYIDQKFDYEYYNGRLDPTTQSMCCYSYKSGDIKIFIFPPRDASWIGRETQTWIYLTTGDGHCYRLHGAKWGVVLDK